MSRKEIRNPLDRINRNNHNDNYKELFNKYKQINKTINNLVLESGESDPEVVQARKGEDTLNDRLNSIEENSSYIENEIIAELEEQKNDIEERLLNFEEDFNKEITSISNSIPRKEENKIKNLDYPLIIPHRGARNIYQEHSLLAYRMQISRGNPLLEIDVRKLKDGTLAIMHDYNMDRTTNGNWSLSTLNNHYYSTRSITDKVTDGEYGYEKQPVPILDQVFREFGVDATYIVESKDKDSSREIVEMAATYGLEDYLMVQSFSLKDLKNIKDEGVAMIWLNGDMTEEKIDEAKENNIDFLGCSKNKSDSYIKMLKDSGLRTFIYTVNRKHEFERVKDLKVDAVFSDDPFYISEDFEPEEKDYFREKVFMNGMLGTEKEGSTRGEFNTKTLSPYTWGFPHSPDTDNDRDFVIQGYLGDVEGEYELKFTAVAEPQSDTWFSVACCLQNDFFDDENLEKTGGGYHLLFGTNSRNLYLYKIKDGEAEKEEENRPSDSDKPTEVDFTLTVKRKSVTLKKENDGRMVSIEDDEFRGGYIAFGRKGAKVMFKDVELTYL